jgi:hypothetical protein
MFFAGAINRSIVDKSCRQTLNLQFHLFSCVLTSWLPFLSKY